jgi:hypothetical protein
MNREKRVRRETDHARIETEIGHILATEEELMPSSGFAASVMDRVRQEAALPAPTPFPWMKAILVILLASGICCWGTVELIRVGLPVLGLSGLGQTGLNWLTMSLPPLSDNLVRSMEEAGWVALALGTSLVCWLFSRRLAGRGGLL